MFFKKVFTLFLLLTFFLQGCSVLRVKKEPKYIPEMSTEIGKGEVISDDTSPVLYGEPVISKSATSVPEYSILQAEDVRFVTKVSPPPPDGYPSLKLSRNKLVADFQDHMRKTNGIPMWNTKPMVVGTMGGKGKNKKPYWGKVPAYTLFNAIKQKTDPDGTEYYRIDIFGQCGNEAIDLVAIRRPKTVQKLVKEIMTKTITGVTTHTIIKERQNYYEVEMEDWNKILAAGLIGLGLGTLAGATLFSHGSSAVTQVVPGTTIPCPPGIPALR